MNNHDTKGANSGLCNSDPITTDINNVEVFSVNIFK